MTSNTLYSPLMSAEELNARLGEDKLKIFDTRGRWGPPPFSDNGAYTQGHIPGAIYVDWTKRLLTRGIAVNLAPVASREEAQADFKALGICADDTVVLYDDYHHMLAGRLWWAMRYWGFTNVKVLNGGWQHWSEQGFVTSTELPQVSSGDYEVNVQSHWRVDINAVRERGENTHLIDARGPIGYAGDPADAKTGHIPGAVNIPYSTLLNEETGLFEADAVLNHLVSRQFNVKEGDAIISSCGSGYAGTVMLLALQQIGLNAALYDGSFSEWKAQPNAPIEQGSSIFRS